jgi:hypothetical protein
MANRRKHVKRSAGRNKTPGKLDPRNNAHLNTILRRAGSPAPLTQPTAGQLIGAKVITPQ